MARNFYCSYCGTELRLKRKALKNKAIIIDLIDPHECDEANVKNITDLDKPTSPIIKQFHEAERRSAMPIFNEDDKVFTDARPTQFKKDQVSSAPPNLLNSLGRLHTSGPEHAIVDLDSREGDDK
jgi:hypothetical protein